MKKALMVATVPSMIGQFNMNNMKILSEEGYEVHVACDFHDRSIWPDESVEDLLRELEQLHIPCHQVDFSRSPFNIRRDVFAYRQLKNLAENIRFDLIHCHAPVASVISRIVAHRQKVRIIYTAHGFHFFKGAPLKNWMLFYPIEKFFARWTDTLITINREDYDRAKKKLNAGQVEYVPGIGVDTAKFRPRPDVRERKRKELHVGGNEIILLSVGELSVRKNQVAVIKAMSKVKRISHVPIRYYICGKGSLHEEYRNLIDNLGLSDTVELLGYRNDICELCAASDIYVFPSLQEGLPVALMEAMACGLPCIASKIRGNGDLLSEGAGGYLVGANDVVGFADRILSLAQDSKKREEMAAFNLRTIQQYSIENVQEKMRKIYG